MLQPISSILGSAHYRQGDRPFGIALHDRLFHMYVIGQTGTGKSTLIKNLALQDAQNSRGVCLIDPHGDLAVSVASTIGRPHLYWNIADPACALGYNPIAPVAATLRPLVCSGLIEALRRQWEDAWGARMEHLLRYSILALLEQPRADIRDVVRLLMEKDFQKLALHRVTDPQVRYFWEVEYPSMNYKNAIDGVAPIANKLGAFLAHPLVRKAMCEPEEPIRFRRLMDEGGILIVNLAKGAMGGDISNVLGGLIVSSIMNAAFSRQATQQGDRRPFMLYVDEFHSFTTTAFAGMLSEVRKYGVGVTLAHQHIVQADRSVFESIMGNVGSMLAFRVGALDAPTVAQQMQGVQASDLINQPNYRAFAQIMIAGEKSKPFSMTTRP
jgi:type IV secretory pathway TraG/TraD family ATPase VirD4